MILCITEKPSVGADIAKILGAKNRKDGYFEGAGYCVTWTFGHLFELKAPEDYNPDWKKWSINTLPMIPEKFQVKIKDDKGIKHQFKIIESLIKKCDKVINCGDAGQEGELIQRWVMQEAKCNKPVERLWISSLTEESIREGFRNLRPQKEYDNLYIAGMCRAVGDWVLGMNATRLYTLRYVQRTYGEKSGVLSIGRVQTPTLAMVVNRQKEIENFVPSTSYELHTIYRDVEFSSNIPAYKREEDGKGLLEELSRHPFIVTDVVKKQVKEAPPRLFDLTSLQIESNKRFGYSADATLKTIQSLYEKKLTTYPRVDTTYLTDDMYPKCGSILNSLSQYQSLMQPIRGKNLLKRKTVFDNSKVTDHHAIIPTGKESTGLTEAESRIYDLIARRFIAVFFPECVYDQTQVTGKVKDVAFKTSGKNISSPGWRSVYIAAKDESEEGDEKERKNDMPDFKVGESGPHKPMLCKKTTQPPAYFTEGTLLKAMETAGNMVDDEDIRELMKGNGIGRPSTRAAIIETLFKRGYMAKQGKSIRATKAGIDLIDIIKEEVLKSAKLTGVWEGNLRGIERGTYSAKNFINEIRGMICSVITNVTTDCSNRKISVSSTPSAYNKQSKKPSVRRKYNKKS